MAKTESLTRNKYILGAMLVILVSALVVYVNSITTFSVIRANPNPTALTSYYGSAPKLDGVETTVDKWNEAGTVSMKYERGNVRIAEKNDSFDLYFLVQWDDSSPAWNDGVAFYFEDDGVTSDRKLDGKNDYFFKNELENCEMARTAGVWDGQRGYWSPYGSSDAEYRCSHANQKWTVEVRVSLTNYYLGDRRFQIPASKPEAMGFAVINWEGGSPGGGASKDSWTWPTDETAYGSPRGEGYTSFGFTNTNDAGTWGQLKIVWNKKAGIK